MWVAVNFAIAFVGAVAVYVWLAVHAVADGSDAWRWIVAFPFVYAAVPLTFTCAWMFFGWLWRAEAPPALRMTAGERVRFFLAEYASLLAAPKMIAFAINARDPPP